MTITATFTTLIKNESLHSHFKTLDSSFLLTFREETVATQRQRRTRSHKLFNHSRIELSCFVIHLCSVVWQLYLSAGRPLAEAPWTTMRISLWLQFLLGIFRSVGRKIQNGRHMASHTSTGLYEPVRTLLERLHIYQWAFVESSLGSRLSFLKQRCRNRVADRGRQYDGHAAISSPMDYSADVTIDLELTSEKNSHSCQSLRSAVECQLL